MTALTWIEALVFGGLAAVARFLVDSAVGARLTGAFPWGTFVVNLSGSFALGLVDGVALTGNALLVVGTATIGSYTTFSTWMLETQRLRDEADFRGAFLNASVSLLVGFGAVALGRAVGVHL